MYIVLVPHLTTGIYSSEQNVINILIKWSRCVWRCSLSLLGLSLSYTLMLDSQEQQFLKRTKCTIFQIIAILGNGEAGKVADPDRHFCSPTSSPDYPYGWPPPAAKTLPPPMRQLYLIAEILFNAFRSYQRHINGLHAGCCNSSKASAVIDSGPSERNSKANPKPKAA